MAVEMVHSRVVSLLRLSTLAMILAPGLAFAQHTHSHSDTTAMAHDMSNMRMDASGDWKTEAMAKHMAYSSPRPLIPADSVRAAHVINELRQAIVKYQDVKVAEADG